MIPSEQNAVVEVPNAGVKVSLLPGWEYVSPSTAQLVGGRLLLSENTKDALHDAFKLIQRSTNAALGLVDYNYADDGTVLGSTTFPVKSFGMEDPRYNYKRAATIYLSRTVVRPKIDCNYNHVVLLTLQKNMKWRIHFNDFDKLLSHSTTDFPYLYWQVSVCRWKVDEEEEENEETDDFTTGYKPYVIRLNSGFRIEPRAT